MVALIRLLLLLEFAGLCLPVWAQNKPAPKDSTSVPIPQLNAAAYQPNLSDLFSNYAPKTPTTAGLSRFGDYPVSMYTGLPTIDIPLFDFKVGTLSIPIKLSYHASGNKVNDLASWVGLGWSLQTGGQITRTVLGRPDEQANGVLSLSVANPSSYYDAACPNDAGDTQITFRADNIYDTQRDAFAYQTPRGSNSFQLGPVTELPNGYVFLKPEPVSVAYDSGLSSLTITDETGTRFRFSDGEATSSNQNTPFGYSGFTSTWYLSEIVGLNSSDRAFYTYSSPVSGLATAPEWIDTQTVIADLVEDPSGSSGITTGQAPPNFRTNAATPIGTRFLQSIQFPGGKITFSLENRTGGGYNLDYLDIFGYNVSQSSYDLIKRIDFGYTSQNRSSGINEEETLLTEVKLMANDLITAIGSYSITYNSTPLPSASSVQKDYWGYYNNNPGTTLIPAHSYTFSSGLSSVGLPIGDANREPDETRMKAWILQSIQYPTGGSTQFDFEANRYAGGTLAGGLRIHQIRSYTATGQLATVKTYKYGSGENGDGTFRSQIIQRPSSILNIKHNESAGGGSRYSYKAYTYSSSPTYPLVPGEGSPVTYSVVTEYRENGLGNNIGKTIYTFRDDASDQYTYLGAGKGYLTSRSWNRGQLLSETVSDEGGHLRSQTLNSYTITKSGSTSSLSGALVVRSVKQTGIKGTSGSCYVANPSGENFDSDDMYLPLLTYVYAFGTVQLSSSNLYTYSDDNSGQYTLKVTQTDYDPTFLLPRETRQLVEGPASSGNAVVGTQYSYPQDFSIPVNATGNELKGIRALQTRNAYLPIETVQYRQESSTLPKNYKTGKLTTYHSMTLNGLETALPYQTYFLESVYDTFSSSAYQSSAGRYSGSSSNFPIDPRYALRVTMNNYDTNGNLLGYTLTNGSSTSFSYGTYMPSGGVLFSSVVTQTQNAGQTNAQTIQYSYTVPLLGMASSTNPRGIVTTYGYDNFGRLAVLKDQNNNVLKAYTYHYSSQP